MFKRSNGAFSAEEIPGLRKQRLAIKLNVPKHSQQIGVVRPVYDEDDEFCGVVWKPAHASPQRWQGVLIKGDTLEAAVDNLFYRLSALIETVNLFLPQKCERIMAGDWPLVVDGIGGLVSAICDTRDMAVAD
jgi:hypothetical protein